jgi:hypothetical protein
MKIITKADKSIPLREMKDGDIAKIVQWGSIKSFSNDVLYYGEVVQRYRDDLLCVGKSSQHGWGKIFPDAFGDNYRVEILPKGTVLEIN